MNAVDRKTFISSLDPDFAVTDVAALIQVTFRNPTQFEELKTKTSEAFRMTIERLTHHYNTYTAIQNEFTRLKKKLSQLKVQDPYAKALTHPISVINGAIVYTPLTEEQRKKIMEEVTAEVELYTHEISEVPKQLAAREEDESLFFSTLAKEIMSQFEKHVKPEDQKAEWEKLSTLGDDYWKQYKMSANLSK